MDRRNRFVLKATVGYIVFAAIWIFFSDRMLEGLASAETAARLGTAKGFAFIAVTATLLVLALRSAARREPPPPRPKGVPWHLVVVLAVFAVAVGTIAAVAFQAEAAAIRRAKVAELEAIARLKVEGISAWLAERRGDAAALSGNRDVRAAAARWLKRPTEADRHYLLDALEAVRTSYGYAQACLVDGRGEFLLGDAEPKHPPAILAPLVRRAVDSGNPQLVDLHRHQPGGRMFTGFVTPASADLPAAFVLTMRPEDQLFATLKSWPVPSRTGELVLVRTEGDQMVFLNEPRQEAGSPVSVPLPPTWSQLPAAHALRGETRILEAHDFGDVPVLAAARAVPDTPWLLVAKEDEDEALAGVRTLARVTGLLAGGALALAALFTSLLWQRQRARDALAELTQTRALDEAESRFQATFEQAAVGISHVGPDGRWLRVNQRLCDMLAYSRDEMLAKTFQDLTHPDDLAEDAKALRRFEAGEIEQHRAEKRYRRQDGTWLWVALTVSVVRDAQRRPDYYITVVQDISERKAAESARDETLRRHRSLFENMLDGYAYCRLIFVDGKPADFVYLDVNPAFYRLTGLADVIGRPVSEVIPGLRQANPDLFEAYGRVAAGGGPERFETYVDALGIWFAVAVYCPEPGHFVAVFDNISERKRGEEKRARLSRIYRALSEANQAIARAGGRQELLAATCRAAADYGGFRLVRIGRLQGEPPVMATVASAGPARGLLQEQSMAEWSHQEQARQQLVELVRGGGKCFDSIADPLLAPWREAYTAFGVHAVGAFPLFEGGEASHIMLFYAPAADYFDEDMASLLGEMAADISLGLENLNQAEALREYRENLERMVEERTADLRQAKEGAEAADRAKSAFLSTMSHELRTPLNSIIGFTSVLQQQLPGPINEEQAKQLAIVSSASHHLLDLVNDVLDIARIEAGQLRLSLQPVDLPQALAQAEATYRPQAEGRGLSFACVAGAGVGRVLADERRLQQVLGNLLANALKFTEQGGVRLSARRAEGMVTVTVEDTGIGIKPEDLGKLFRPFQQLDTAAARLREGTGLGLAICRQLVAAMGGEIEVQSTPGVGSRFSFTLPAGGEA